MKIEEYGMLDKNKRKFFSTIERLFGKVSSTPPKVAIITYDKRYSMAELFKEHVPAAFDGTTFEIDKSEIGDIFKFRLKLYGGDVEPSCLLINLKEWPIGIILSNAKHVDFKNVQLAFFRGYYPLISRTFFSSVELLKLLRRIEKTTEIDIEAQRYVVKRYYGKKETRLCFTKTPYSDLFLNAVSEHMWVDSIVVNLKGKSETNSVSKLRIGRDGIFSYRNMGFAKFFVFVLEELLKTWNDELYKNTLENRTRSFEDVVAKPIKIKLKSELFLEENDALKFIAVIKGLPKWGYSVISLNKFFVELNVLDYVSGGSFDITVPASNEIHIIPQTQVTPTVFNRLLSFLTENYEGEIQNV